ncbi:MAG: peptidoglycan-binding protein [Aureispira sp.]|nr:peptidoglycan-binding protein [Aureispira sp.]
MQTIPLDFDIQKIENIKNLVVVLGYIRGENFDVEINKAGVLPEVIRVYVEELQEQNALEPNGKVNQDTILIINNLLMDKKYQDPSYVAILHQWLIALGYSISAEENTVSLYGETTTSAVKNAQISYGLSATGQVDAETEQILEEAYNILNSDHQVSGTVLDSSWQGVAGVTVKVFEKLLRNGEALLGEANTAKDGHYQLGYNTPINTTTGNPKEFFHLIVKVYDLEGTEMDSQTFFKVNDSIEANFVAGNWGYKGVSIFEKNKDLLEKSLGEELSLLTIEESAENQDVTFLYADTGMVKDEIMKMALAHRISEALNVYENINPAIIYAFLYQNAPQNLPSYLLPINLNDWNQWIGGIVPELTKGIIFTNPVVQQSILNKATTRNILPIESLLNLDAVVEQLQAARLNYALDEAVVENKIALNDLLNLTSISEEVRPLISSAFAERLSLDEGFMQQVQELEGVEEGMLEELKAANLYAKISGYYAPAMQVCMIMFSLCLLRERI